VLVPKRDVQEIRAGGRCRLLHSSLVSPLFARRSLREAESSRTCGKARTARNLELRPRRVTQHAVRPAGASRRRRGGRSWVWKIIALIATTTGHRLRLIFYQLGSLPSGGRYYVPVELRMRRPLRYDGVRPERHFDAAGPIRATVVI
jgi:hypothetical protein